MSAPLVRLVIAGALLLAPLTAPAVAPAADPPTAQTITGALRDFRGSDVPSGHDDFENGNGNEAGIVAATLGSDGRPVYAKDGSASTTTHGKTLFDQWFSDVAGVNLSAPLTLTLDRRPDGRYGYDSPTFFPADGWGWPALGQEPLRPDSGGQPHNFSFTTELHSEIQYTGSGVVDIRGDDDIWVFVNGRRAVDLGGVHGPMTGAIDLAARAGELGLQVGRIYDLDVFQAERHTSGSSFRLTTPQLGVLPGTAAAAVDGAFAGAQATCTPGGWSPDAQLTYTWLRGGAPIAGATGAAYVTQAADAGAALTCRVTGSRRAGAPTSSADSAPVTVGARPVTPPTPDPIVPTPPPLDETPPVTPPTPPTPGPFLPTAPRTDAPAAERLPCLSRRRFTITLKVPAGTRLARATVTVGGRRVTVRRAGRTFTATIDLRRKPVGRYTVRVRSTTAAGRAVREERSYRVCATSRRT